MIKYYNEINNKEYLFKDDAIGDMLENPTPKVLLKLQEKLGNISLDEMIEKFEDQVYEILDCFVLEIEEESFDSSCYDETADYIMEV